jgi:hypothetical protein
MTVLRGLQRVQPLVPPGARGGVATVLAAADRIADIHRVARRLADGLEEINHLHQPGPRPDDYHINGDVCRTCHTHYPCQTAQIIAALKTPSERKLR